MLRIRASRLVEPLHRTCIEDAVLLLDEGRVVAAGPSATVGDPGGPSETAYYPDATIMPGLIDTHCHLNFPGDGTAIEVIGARGRDELLATSAANARLALRSGVTALRDNGSARGTAVAVRDMISKGDVEGPLVLASATPLTVPRGHTWPLGGEVRGPIGMRRAVGSQLAGGADFIKIIGSGGGTRGTDAYSASYSMAELAVAVAEAHRAARRTVVHATCTAAVETALDAGADMITHATFYDSDGRLEARRDIADRLAQERVWVNPTLHVANSLVLRLEADSECRALNDEGRAELARRRMRYAEAVENFDLLRVAGCRIVAGSDSGWRDYPFGGFHLELRAMADAGMSNWDVLRSATCEAAAAIERPDLGSLLPGSPADFVILEGDPLRDIRALGRVRGVYQRGRLVRGTHQDGGG